MVQIGAQKGLKINGKGAQKGVQKGAQKGLKINSKGAQKGVQKGFKINGKGAH